MPLSHSSPHASCVRWLGAAVLLISTAGSRASASVPRLDHVIVVIMENKSYDQVRTKPYISSLITQGTVFTNSYAITHPSLPNYLALWAGTTMGLTTDGCPPPGFAVKLCFLRHPGRAWSPSGNGDRPFARWPSLSPTYS